MLGGSTGASGQPSTTSSKKGDRVAQPTCRACRVEREADYSTLIPKQEVERQAEEGQEAKKAMARRRRRRVAVL
jgi:hypothetical protein